MNGSVQAVEQVDAAATRPLRQRVLRTHQRVEDVVLPGDAHPDACHLAIRDLEGDIVAVGTVVPEARSDDAAGEWRVRGMATEPHRRGAGLGSAILEGCLKWAEERGSVVVWCTARTPVTGFYGRHGFREVGPPFDLPDIGPHVVMVRAIDQEDG